MLMWGRMSCGACWGASSTVLVLLVRGCFLLLRWIGAGCICECEFMSVSVLVLACDCFLCFVGISVAVNVALNRPLITVHIPSIHMVWFLDDHIDISHTKLDVDISLIFSPINHQLNNTCSTHCWFHGITLDARSNTRIGETSTTKGRRLMLC